jgi:hypothetical protein
MAPAAALCCRPSARRPSAPIGAAPDECMNGVKRRRIIPERIAEIYKGYAFRMNTSSVHMI